MKKFFNCQKTLFSVICAFVLSLICGFGFMDMHYANALDSSYNIYDYDWANYFNADALWENCEMVDDPSLSDYPVLKVTNSTPAEREYIRIGQDIFGSNGCLKDCLPDVVYTIQYNFSLSANISSDNIAGLGLALHDTTSGSTVEFWGHYYKDYLLSVPYGHTIDLYVVLDDDYDFYLQPIPAFGVINFIELAVYRGTSVNYDYTPYFYSLETLPEIDSSEDSSGSDSGSGDSGSDIPDRPDIPDGNGSYQEGYLAGLSQAQYGIFRNCQCYIQLNYANNYERISITDDFFIYGGLDLSKFYALVSGKSGVLSSFIFFNFGNSSSVRPNVTYLNFYATGSESVFISNPWFVTLENTPNSKNLHWDIVSSSTDNNPVFKTKFMDVGVAGSTVVLSFRTPTFSTFAYLDGLTLTMADNSFNAGYINGNSDGYSSGLQAGLNDNQQAIYDEGHRVGYDDGFAKGYAENNSFLGLFTAAIDAPVITFTSMLDFDILGYNMKALVLSLLSAALVVCLIRLFAKGGAT